MLATNENDMDVVLLIVLADMFTQTHEANVAPGNFEVRENVATTAKCDVSVQKPAGCCQSFFLSS